MSGIVLAVLTVAGVGAFIGIFLGIASLKFKVEVNEKLQLFPYPKPCPSFLKLPKTDISRGTDSKQHYLPKKKKLK